MDELVVHRCCQHKRDCIGVAVFDGEGLLQVVRWWVSTNRTSDVRLGRLVFCNGRSGLPLESVLVEMKEDAELLGSSI
jgi:hypothetical protein